MVIGLTKEELLSSLEGKEITAEAVAQIISHNNKKIEEGIIKLLDKRSKDFLSQLSNWVSVTS